ncbi:hypothetical protein phiCbK_167 [Caulobacter phage phiCbK]|uniref:DUF1643 domain-containing protein n=5 Tax=Viruses TaxID=10239 RepID=K4JPQ2_9CAUD|nr:DUF1643 protein [Caulobacter phage phiCbK]AFO71682.1 hypothetical protein phiCbK_167 [Caulobacter phage phiCbK]AFU86986.1 DUF1643 protein [Caulobacter phage phiCbK]ARB15068.1 hypothetical protein Ccr32_gp150 [Caulobacter phage Ccr32]ARB15402.1 hypothetical protein Ccr34_gp160 [Caulobacter phage Ccr34]
MTTAPQITGEAVEATWKGLLQVLDGTSLEAVFDPDLTDVYGDAVVEDGVIKAALLSRCETFRYLLMRVWDPGKPLLIFLMLNPSTATARLDDPTIRRCMGFARRDDYGGIIVANLFAFRSPSPAAMKAAEDPIGPMNARVLQHVFEYAMTAGADVIAAWGVHGEFKDQDYGAVQQAEITGVEVKCLGKSKDGHPRHPLYLRGDQPVVRLRSA